jgi:predicted kinase
MINTLYLIRGLPGSGKSTEAKRLEATSPGLFRHVEADMYFILGDEYIFDASKLKQAHEWCQSKTEEYLERGYNTIVSNTFTTLKEIKPYEEIAKRLSVKLEVYQMNNSFKNIHNVPEETLRKMKSRWQEYPNCIQIPPTTLS